MIPLDNFKAVFNEHDGTCAQCNHSGEVFAFWETHAAAPDKPSDWEVCVDCLFTMSGRFKNHPPASVLRKFEEVTSINVTDERVQIGTRSPFGYYFHVHYTSMDFAPTPDPIEERPQTYEYHQTLSGESEIFTEDGDHFADISPYSSLARRALEKSG